MYFADLLMFSFRVISNINMGSTQISKGGATLALFNMTENYTSNNLKRYVTFQLLCPLVETRPNNKLCNMLRVNTLKKFNNAKYNILN